MDAGENDSPFATEADRPLPPGKTLAFVSDLTAGVAGVALVILMVFTVIDVALRQTAGGGVRGIVELVQTALAAVVFLGLMAAQVHGDHVRTPLLVSRLPPRPAEILRRVGLFIAFTIVMWMTYAASFEAWESVAKHEYTVGILHVPFWPARVIAAIGLAAFALALARDLVARIRTGLPRREAVEQ